MATTAKRASNRGLALLDAAALQFAEQGYRATTIRELAAATEMTPGAIYFHVVSKQALLLAVYEEGVQRILDRLDAAVVGEKDPWVCLEDAVCAHLECILDASAYARVVIRILPSDVPDLAAELTALRDRCETRFRKLIAAILLPKECDTKLIRLFLLGAINWTPVWYTKGRKSPRAIARELIAPLRALGGVTEASDHKQRANAISR
ncbi:MAG TPA: TetR/AcrR family transcriptional regulator [Steroidobacteraceae bacterium]